jgi:hypothetical protein
VHAGSIDRLLNIKNFNLLTYDDQHYFLNSDYKLSQKLSYSNFGRDLSFTKYHHTLPKNKYIVIKKTQEDAKVKIYHGFIKREGLCYKKIETRYRDLILCDKTRIYESLMGDDGKKRWYMIYEGDIVIDHQQYDHVRLEGEQKVWRVKCNKDGTIDRRIKFIQNFYSNTKKGFVDFYKKGVIDTHCECDQYIRCFNTLIQDHHNEIVRLLQSIYRRTSKKSI